MIGTDQESNVGVAAMIRLSLPQKYHKKPTRVYRALSA